MSCCLQSNIVAKSLCAGIPYSLVYKVAANAKPTFSSVIKPHNGGFYCEAVREKGNQTQC